MGTFTILLASDRAAPLPLDDLAAALAHRQVRGMPVQVHTVDLARGPSLSRLRLLLGLGWHAGPTVRKAERAIGRPIDAVIEAPQGAHHLMGLGRVRRPTVRIPGHGSPYPDANAWRAPDIHEYLDIASANEGAMLLVPDALVPPASVQAWRARRRIPASAEVHPFVEAAEAVSNATDPPRIEVWVDRALDAIEQQLPGPRAEADARA